MEIALKIFSAIVGIVAVSVYVYIFADVFKDMVRDLKEGKEDE